MKIRKLALIPGLLLVAACEQPVAPNPEDAGLIQAAKGGKPGKPGKPGDGDEVFNYTITDLGTDITLNDINDDGVLAGSSSGQAAVWFQAGGQPLLLGDPEEKGSLARRINAAGTQVVGTHWNAQDKNFGDLWELDGASVTNRIPLNPLEGDDETVPSGINDNGQVVGQSDNNVTQRAVLWEPDGSGNMIPRDLRDLPGFPGSWAQSINNAGHAVGRSGIDAVPSRPRAVMWFVEGTSVTVIDLTADSDDSGDNHALDITEPVAGLVQITGYTSIAGQRRQTVWTVDVQTKNVTSVRIEAGSSIWSSINQLGEVNVGSVVWTPAQDLVEPLPALSDRCGRTTRSLNNNGTVIGSSGIKVKRSCVGHAVIWTKITS